MNIRELRVDEAATYVRLRAEMVADSPWAFAVSEAEPESVVAERLCWPGNVIAGAWEGARPWTTEHLFAHRVSKDLAVLRR